MKNRIIAMVSAVVLSLSTFVFPTSFDDKSVVIANAQLMHGVVSMRLRIA